MLCIPHHGDNNVKYLQGIREKSQFAIASMIYCSNQEVKLCGTRHWPLQRMPLKYPVATKLENAWQICGMYPNLP
jgi:hypothetical protein